MIGDYTRWRDEARRVYDQTIAGFYNRLTPDDKAWLSDLRIDIYNDKRQAVSV